MKFDMENLNPPTWFDFGDDARIQMRVCSGDDLDKIQKKTRKIVHEYRRGDRHQWEDIDQEKEFKMVNDFIIVDWENINDGNGVELQCNTKNKEKLLRGSPLFSSFIASCLEKLNNNIGHIQEEEEKNS